MKSVIDTVPHIRQIRAPPLNEILAEDPVPHYPYNVTFDELPDDPVITLHTSGSSGNPKPIEWNKWAIAKIDQANDLPEDQGQSLTKTVCYHENKLCLLPCFHVSTSSLQDRLYCLKAR